MFRLPPATLQGARSMGTTPPPAYPSPPAPQKNQSSHSRTGRSFPAQAVSVSLRRPERLLVVGPPGLATPPPPTPALPMALASHPQSSRCELCRWGEGRSRGWLPAHGLAPSSMLRCPPPQEGGGKNGSGTRRGALPRGRGDGRLTGAPPPPPPPTQPSRWCSRPGRRAGTMSSSAGTAGKGG